MPRSRIVYFGGGVNGDKTKAARIEVRENLNDHVVGEYDGRKLTVK